MAEEQSNIKIHSNVPVAGMNMDNSLSQVQRGQLTYSLNGTLENYDQNGVSYQNEPGNTECLEFPSGYICHGKHFIPTINKHIFFLVNPSTGDSEIGYMENNDCIYHTFINSICLGFNINYPIHKIVHKITNCSVQVFFTDGLNNRRFIDLDNPPYKTVDIDGQCEPKALKEIDCNKLNVQPNYNIPQIEVVSVTNGGSLTAGTVQFAIQYSDASGNGYTSYHSITNPTPIANSRITTPDFNYNVGKSVNISISNIDTTGYFQYFNIAVIKTINNIASVEVIGTYFIEDSSKSISYNGQNQTQIRLTINDIFEKHPNYEIAKDLTTVQDVIVWDQLSAIDRINYQKIANKIRLQWVSYRIPATEDYSDELNATNLKSYLRDEVYPYEIVWLIAGGKETDAFHIPGRAITPLDSSNPDIASSNNDFIGTADPVSGTSPYWKIYNTAIVEGTDSNYTSDSSYKGPYQYGQFAYWESTETYPCQESIWGELAGQPIRHHKFPDVNISPIFESSTPETDSNGKYTNLQMGKKAIFPIGVRIDPDRVKTLIQESDLTQSQKDAIIGFKIVRGNRDVNKSIVGKGILRNVGKYTREDTEYYFPNYPYNDLREDPFLLSENNAYNSECNSYTVNVTADGVYEYTDCFTNTLKGEPILAGATVTVCSLTVPTVTDGGTVTITEIGYDTYSLSSKTQTKFSYKDVNNVTKYILVKSTDPKTIQVYVSTKPKRVAYDTRYTVSLQPFSKNVECYPSRLKAFETDDSKYRQVFNSPETSFGQPFLGTILKMESILYGTGKAHFTEVKKNAMYKLLSKEAQEDALSSSGDLGALTVDFNTSGMFQAYQAYIEIYTQGITRKNYGYSYNSILDYNYSAPIPNNGNKQRELENSQYLASGVQSINEQINFNNFQRESSVYLKTEGTKSFLPFPSIIEGGISRIDDQSRFINSQVDCSKPEKQFDITSIAYYGSLKNYFPNQWGQIYSYDVLDTGFQIIFNQTPYRTDIFGGDTFIGKFAFKTKLPFFIDNRVGAPNDSDVFYDELGNIAYPEYWHSSRNLLFDYKYTGQPKLTNIISIKAHNFDCPNNQLPKPDSEETPNPITNPDRTFYDGKIYMFAYGVPYFYCESSINLDLRQAFNSKEGDFYPHVSSGIPDDWVQESNVSIANDNTYYYNVTYSKQNKENFFSHLPVDWEDQLCYTHYPFRAIYSEPQSDYSDNRINSWLIYRPSSFFDFPQNYGKLVSLDGIQNRQVLARFENKSLLYNALYTTQTNTGGQVYLGQNLFSKNTPPLDFSETDLGYVGSQHKFLLKIPQGQVSVDAKRGQVFLLSDSSVTELSGFGSGLHRFYTDHLAFEILRYFPEVDVDNHFKGIGLHGVFDSKFDRVILSKLDYIPTSTDVKYDSSTKEFYIEKLYNEQPIKTIVSVYDEEYFCNKSWTTSLNLNTKTWVSFHSYIPNFYIGENNFFYSGINTSCDLEAIAATILPIPTTTTTTSTSSTSTTSTTSSSTTSTTSTSSTTTTTTTQNYGDFVIDGTYNVTINSVTGDADIPAVSPSSPILPYYAAISGTMTVNITTNGMFPTGRYLSLQYGYTTIELQPVSNTVGAHVHNFILPYSFVPPNEIRISVVIP